MKVRFVVCVNGIHNENFIIKLLINVFKSQKKYSLSALFVVDFTNFLIKIVCKWEKVGVKGIKVEESGVELLTGEYRNTLDEKGRISFPTKLRNGLFSENDKNILVLTQSFDNCLWLYTKEEWQKLSSKIMETASPFNKQNRLVLRHFIGPAQEVELDKAGRLSIPQSLREYANLSKECVIIGINKYMELWDAETYDRYLEENENSLKEAAEALGEISF